MSVAVLFIQLAVRLAHPKLAVAGGEYETPPGRSDGPAKPVSKQERALLAYQVSRLLLSSLLLALSVATTITGKSEGEGYLLDLTLIAVYVRETTARCQHSSLGGALIFIKLNHCSGIYIRNFTRNSCQIPSK